MAQLGPFIAGLLLRDNPVSLLDSPYLSPAGSTVPAEPGLFAGFPPTFIVTGGKEYYVESVRELVRRLQISGVDYGASSDPFAETHVNGKLTYHLW